MTRSSLACTLLAAACATQLDVGLGADESTSNVTVAATTNGSTSFTDTTDSGVDATTSTSSAATTSDASSSSEGTDGGSSTGGDTDGLETSPCLAEQKVCAEVELDGAPVGFCGQTLELEGLVVAIGPGRWSIEDCDTCGSCGGTSYEVEILAPADWVPVELPPCARIAIDFAPLDDSPFPCAFTGIAIWDEQGGSSEDPAPVYVAASITTDPPAALAGLAVSKQDVAPKACAMLDCCYMPPGKYELTFGGASIGVPVVLAEHEEALGVAVFSQPYDLRNERSHAHEQCDKIPHFDWILRR